ncbi:MAG: glycosyl transferase group 1 [uncultured bacterium]|nr:MAG: glycosyl transferase group 1 [uncultured bacterium]HCU70616.1 glycosyltransferase family 4 protein [Candidatus Moranbacteria bacterium]
MKKEPKVAIVHDFLTDLGGAERVLGVLCEIFPEAPIYTLLYDKESMKGRFSDKIIHVSFLQNFPRFLKRRKKWLLPFIPIAPETFDLRDFDLVISSSGAWTKGIVTRLNTVHISYVHSPIRFAWDANEQYLIQQKRSKAINLFARFFLNYIRLWDRTAADRPDFLIANSKYTQNRIKKYYGRESMVIYPPACVEADMKDELACVPSEEKKHFLIVSRLSPYKKIDAAIEAFNKLGLPLIVIGEGQQKKYLQSIAEKNVKILGYKSDEEIEKYYIGARGFIFAGVDDFGISCVEAMAHGVPVLAIQKGGAKEIVIEGKTGEFFDAATPEVIADGVRRLIENENGYDREVIRMRAQEFSKEKFISKIKDYISKN